MDFLANTSNIRNICILAHVDHGKTTIADSLIASNGIISQRLAGKMRYMDNQQEEQERGITMKSSSIALKYINKTGEKYMINLVDTPGHVDFCGEVSAAVRLCDGALIVIDVVEGVCPQTKLALEHAWKEGIEPILVLNKIDRLCLEQKLDEVGAYQRLSHILEQVNAIVATLLTTEVFENEAIAESYRQRHPSGSAASKISQNGQPDGSEGVHVYDWASAIEDIDDDQYYFMPEKNNVLFVCSIDDWAFTIESFAQIISTKNKINLTALRKTLWGDFYLDMKQQRIMKNAQAKSKKNLFTTMVLENIWRLYDTICVRRDKVGMEKICKALDVNLTQRDLNHTDTRYQVKLVMNKWLHLANNVLDSVTKLVPSPNELSVKRIERLLCYNLKHFNQLPEETRKLKDTFLQCSSSDDVVKMACISKMIPIEKSSLPQYKRRPIKGVEPKTRDGDTKAVNLAPVSNDIMTIDDPSDKETVFIAFARVFSGNIKKGDKLYVLGPRHDPSRVTEELISNISETKKLEDLNVNEHVTVATIDNCYLLMGRELELIDRVPAGNIIGIQGLEHHLVRTATLSSSMYCTPFHDLHVPAPPILRVAIEPTNPLDMQTLIKGLKLLNQADPCVEVKLQQTGEHVIVATGEVHLQHCLKDLRERYANNIELNVSNPIVPFRETLVLPPKIDMVNEAIDDNNAEFAKRKQANKVQEVELLTPNKRCKIKMKASPLPELVVNCLTKDFISHLKAQARLLTSKSKQQSIEKVDEKLSDYHARKVIEFKENLKKYIDESCAENPDWKSVFQGDDFIDRIWSFGPKYNGPNILVAHQDLSVKFSQWLRFDRDNDDKASGLDDLVDYVDSFVSGFQLATQSGPLCEEPMMGVCFTILDWSYQAPETGKTSETSEADSNIASVRDNYGPMSGQIISTVKDCCRKAFQVQPQRLMSPMFSCDIQVTCDAQGRMYAVLGRRHGRIVHGDMREGSQTFEVKAYVPVIESLDFVSEIRDQTSGMANPQLIFSHFELLDLDPFWTPSTEEEYALYGEKADTGNLARKYMNLVRRRKGLSVHEKIVEHGEKQRTIKRNK